MIKVAKYYMNFRLWLETEDSLPSYEFVLPIFGADDKKMVYGNVEKVDASFAKDPLYVSSGGVRTSEFKEFLKKGTPIEVPYVTIYQNEISFINGRHRYSVLRDMGYKHIPFAIQKSQARLFEKLFG